MAYGIQLFNDYGQLLVDSDFEHFHFAGKATYVTRSIVPPIVGGDNTQHSTRDGQYISSSQENGDIFKYTLYANASADSPAPICFIKPVTTGPSAPSCGIILTRRSGLNWEIWVLQTYGWSAPTLYCFLPLRRMLSTYAAPGANDKFSLQTFSSTGIRTYDARVRPMKVIASGTTTSPSVARAGSKANGWEPVFTPDAAVNSQFSAISAAPASDLIFFCPSIAHSCQDHREQHSGEGYQSQGYNSFFYAWAREDLWWCFYRSTFRIIDSGTLQSRYDIYASGHVWKSQEDSTSLVGALAAVAFAFFTFGASLIVIGVAVAALAATAAFTNSGVASGTYYPYRNGSRNALQSNGFMISRASYYE